jgi:predicted ester cyclase
MNIKDFAEKFIKAEEDAFQKGDFTALAKLEDPNVVYHMSYFGDLIGHEGHKQNIMAGRQNADIKQQWQYLTDECNLFALSLKELLVFKGNTPGMPPAGKEASNDCLFLLRLKHGRIVEVWSYGIWKGLDIEALVKALKN